MRQQLATAISVLALLLPVGSVVFLAGCETSTQSGPPATGHAAVDSAGVVTSTAPPTDTMATLPETASRGPASVDIQPDELPDLVVKNSVSLINNIANTPIMVQAEPPAMRRAPEQLNYLDKHVIDVPEALSGPVAFVIWPKTSRIMQVRCPLVRGGTYQVFLNKKTRKLAVAPVVP